MEGKVYRGVDARKRQGLGSSYLPRPANSLFLLTPLLFSGRIQLSYRRDFGGGGGEAVAGRGVGWESETGLAGLGRLAPLWMGWITQWA
jgi:hypothetical protein